MAIVLTIDGTPRAIKDRSLRLARTANGRATLYVGVRSLDASYRPALDDEILLEEDTERIFGGTIAQVRERGAVKNKAGAIVTDITAIDFNGYADRRIISSTFAGGSLESLLTSAETILSIYGVTLDAAQVTGPTLPATAYTIKTMTEVLNDWMALTAEHGEPFVWEIDAFKVLRAFQPSTVAAPFDITGSPPYPAVVGGDLTIERKRDSSYANSVTIYVPPITQFGREETFTGDGTEDTFVLTYVPFEFRGLVTVAGVEETLGVGATWTYDAGTNSITRNAGAPANGAAISIIFSGTFTALANAEDATEIAAVGRYDKVIVRDAIPTGTTAQALADAELAMALVVPELARYSTTQLGLAVGQSQTITVAARNVNATAVITDIVSSDLATRQLIHDVTATIDASQTNLNRGWRTVYRRWLGDVHLPRSAGATSTGTGNDPGGTPSGGGYSYVRKTADETVNNTDTLQPDDHLLFSVEANAIYEFELVLVIVCNSATADWKFNWTVPSGTTMLWGFTGEGTNPWPGGSHLTSAAALESASTEVTGGGASHGNPSGRIGRGIITSGSTAGTVTLQWAQNTPTVVDNTVKANSFIKYRRIG